jgi:hypothetical protein
MTPHTVLVHGAIHSEKTIAIQGINTVPKLPVTENERFNRLNDHRCVR